MKELLTAVSEGIQVRKYVSEWVLTGKEEGQSQEENYFVDFRHKFAPRKHVQQGGLRTGEGVEDFQLPPESIDVSNK
jgi:hypothetical protein